MFNDFNLVRRVLKENGVKFITIRMSIADNFFIVYLNVFLL